MLQKYFKDKSSDNQDTTSSGGTAESGTIRDRLKASLVEYTKSSNDIDVVPDNFKKEFLWFDRNKKRSLILDDLYNALLTIQPTSTESERNFSISGNILSKKRKSLLDKNLHAIVFVKSYLRNLL